MTHLTRRSLRQQAINLEQEDFSGSLPEDMTEVSYSGSDELLIDFSRGWSTLRGRQLSSPWPSNSTTKKSKMLGRLLSDLS